MPQLSQLSQVYLSQFLWLAVALGFIFFVIARGMVPKIQATVDAREQRIAGDLEAAQKARAAADETEADWRARMDAARAEAARLANEAKQEGARQTEASVKAAAEKINLRVESATGKIREALDSARAEVENVAADATREMVARLTGIAIDPKEAAAAVKAELNVRAANPGIDRPCGGTGSRRAVIPRAESRRMGRARDAGRLRRPHLEEGPGGDRPGSRQQDRAYSRPARRSGSAPQGG